MNTVARERIVIGIRWEVKDAIHITVNAGTTMLPGCSPKHMTALLDPVEIMNRRNTNTITVMDTA